MEQFDAKKFITDIKADAEAIALCIEITKLVASDQVILDNIPKINKKLCEFKEIGNSHSYFINITKYIVARIMEKHGYSDSSKKRTCLYLMFVSIFDRISLNEMKDILSIIDFEKIEVHENIQLLLNKLCNKTASC